jgi:hypothetical protein
MTTVGQKLLVALAGTILLAVTVAWDAHTRTIIRNTSAHSRNASCPAPDSYSTEIRPGPALSCRNK